ncbi:MAG TPA: protein kinase [Gemmatimonadales bacterium]|nr:protein kinase [Gemmatimonadales bacterium]
MADAATIAVAAALADRYRIERQLGQGGMAVVYLAEDLKHHRQVAIKVVRPELAGVLGAERFLREIEIAAALHHPHILPLYDSGEARPASGGTGVLFYVMPYVDGQSLRDRLNRERQLPIDEALRIAREVADALSYAHGRGIVHRDIKPENILLDAGHAVVADFGIARAVSAAGGDELTATGITLGTPAYMSPEQAAGGTELDGRSDLYSLACVLYEMLAGQPPFSGPTAASVIHQHVAAAPPPITQIRPAVPAELAGTLARALAKTPADRFNPVAQFAEALAPRWSTALGTVPSAEPSSVRLGRRRLVLVAVATAVAAALLVAGYRLWGRGQAETPSGATSTPRVAVLPFTNLGAPGDQYFAEGVTDEITSRTGQLGGLEVIARSSAAKYAGRDPDLAAIVRDLDVDYVLEGSIRWQRAPDGPGRVRVTPELVRAADGTQLWTERYDAVLADIFQVQTDIAEKVAAALGVALRRSDSAAAAPTSDLEAYDLFLQANGFVNRGTASQDMHAAVGMYEQAVRRDSTFALAWARLAYAHLGLYWFRHDPTPARLQLAEQALDRAVALAPGTPDVELAQGWYAYWGHRDYTGALQHFGRAFRARPNDADIISGIAAVQRRQGRFESALAGFTRGLALDPRGAERARGVAETYRILRRFPEAIQQWDRAIALAPDQAVSYLQKAQAQILAGGAIADARRTVEEGVARNARDPDVLRYALVWLDGMEGRYSDALERLAGVTQEVTIGQLYTSSRSLSAADLHGLMGHQAVARAYADSAAAALRAALVRSPDDAGLTGALGIAYAGAGRREEALRAGRRATELLPYNKDAWGGGYRELELARIYTMLGERDSALARLEHVLSVPMDFTSALLRVDPVWAPLRGDPHFRRLAGEF